MCGRVRQTLEQFELDLLVKDLAGDRDDAGGVADDDTDRGSNGDGGGGGGGDRPDRDLLDMRPNYNGAPSQHLIVILDDESRLRGPTPKMMRWGFIPPWEKEPTGGRKPINAKIETIRENLALGRGMWRDAVKRGRCIFPVNSFYEWDRSKKPSVPYAIERADGRPLGLAALYAIWRNPETQMSEMTFAVVTCEPNRVMAAIHNRMPVILTEAEQRLWLQGPLEAALDICKPCPSEYLRIYRVSKKVGNVANNDPSILLPEPELPL